MANIRYSDLLPDVLPYLAADPSNPLTETVLRRVVIDFCSGSWIWKYLPDPLDVVAGDAYCDLEIPPGTAVAAVLSAQLDGYPIKPRNTVWLDANLRNWRTEQGTPRFVTQVDTAQVILAPVPDTAQSAALNLTLALQPSATSTTFPSWIYALHADTIIAGTLSRLMGMPEKPWTDHRNADMRAAQYTADVANARNSAVSALGAAPLRTTTHH